jgi:L-asparaginase II
MWPIYSGEESRNGTSRQGWSARSTLAIRAEIASVQRVKDSASQPILATVYRGPAPESYHTGHIVVADVQGEVRWQTPGLTEQPVFYRSASKPLQALPLVETGAADAFGLGAEELALSCASHSGEPRHVRIVTRMLARSPRLSPRCLQCGTHIPYSAEVAAKLARHGRKPPVTCHNCSGKHAAMLLGCVHNRWPIATYTEPSHPLQKRIKSVVAEFADLPVAGVITGKDGCNLPAHAVSLRRMAMTYARLATPAYWTETGNPARAKAVETLTSAMRRHPFVVSGTGRSDLCLMKAAKGAIFSKIGAEAVWCMGFPHLGLGLALKISDGSNRAEIAILAEALKQAGLLGPAERRQFVTAHERPITSTDGSVVGRYEACFRLSKG